MARLYLIPKVLPVEPFEQLLDHDERGLEEDAVAQQEVLDVVRVG